MSVCQVEEPRENLAQHGLLDQPELGHVLFAVVKSHIFSCAFFLFLIAYNL